MASSLVPSCDSDKISLWVDGPAAWQVGWGGLSLYSPLPGALVQDTVCPLPQVVALGMVGWEGLGQVPRNPWKPGLPWPL